MRICVFGAASPTIDPEYIARVEELGREMAKRGHSLVFGAGGNGLMGAAARGVHQGGGYVLGVIPKFFEDEGVEAIYAPEHLYRTDDEALIAQLEEAGLLAYAEPDYPVELMEAPNDPGWTEGKQWDLEAIGMPYAWERGIDGRAADGTRIRVGIVDSGVYAEHQDLKNAHFVPGVNILAEEGTEERSNTTDTYGHGTFVTGIMAVHRSLAGQLIINTPTHFLTTTLNSSISPMRLRTLSIIPLRATSSNRG